ncbi:MAG: ribonuclease P protein component [Candidatus Nomurabacteria bacterium]|nr:MAG: ribonuclease P protein component [Candidatus Nomurabacteria bacterium]
MLPAAARLRKEQDVQRVRRFGRQARTTHLAVRVAKSSVKGPRLTVVVAKRVDKRATVRNSIKRKIRAQLQELYPKLLTHCDILISTQPSTKNCTSSDLRADLEFLFRRLRLFHS